MNIAENTPAEELLRRYPLFSKTFINLGLPCPVCGEALWGMVEDLVVWNNIDVAHVINALRDRQRELHEGI